MTLTVLNVAYPFAAVGPDAVGGAEQVLSQLDAALVAAGHRSVVIACEGSATSGALVPVPCPGGLLNEREQMDVHVRYRQAIAETLQRWPFDLVHMHGCDFHAYLPQDGTPVLATLHLSPACYPASIFASTPNLWLQCVSEAQYRACPGSAQLLQPIENGAPAALFDARQTKRFYALVLGRICPEKGIHLAIDAAKEAGIPLLIAGEVFPYEAHRRYFRTAVEPRLDSKRRFIGPVGFARKRRLLAAARCVLIPSLVDETSSLVAREALACGTPVIAFPRGALRDTVDSGATGFLVDDARAMAVAILQVDRLDPKVCRAVARERFSHERMLAQYLAMYASLARRPDLSRGAA
jgi:Glycosyl transferases group 1/Glycosyltransferase Family 4